MKYVQRWDAKRLKARIAGHVVNGMEKACQFAEAQAEAKAPRRRGILTVEIAHAVKAHGDEVVGYVGVKKGRAFYGYFQELGTRKAAAHPFLRPAVFEHPAVIVRLIAEG